MMMMVMVIWKNNRAAMIRGGGEINLTGPSAASFSSSTFLLYSNFSLQDRSPEMMLISRRTLTKQVTKGFTLLPTLQARRFSTSPIHSQAQFNGMSDQGLTESQRDVRESILSICSQFNDDYWRERDQLVPTQSLQALPSLGLPFSLFLSNL